MVSLSLTPLVCWAVSAGEHLEATGKWVVDREHGQQFKADELKTTHPASAEGIEKYLASGAIRSIRLGRHNLCRIKNLHGTESRKVFDVEREQMRKAMPLHRRDKTCVVRRFSLDAMRCNQPLPPLQNTSFVAQRRKNRFECRDFRFGLINRKTESILASGASGNRPKLINDLGNNAQLMLAVPQDFDRTNGRRMHGMAGLRKTP